MTAITFRGGLPFGPDLERLREAFPIPSLVEGRIITHEEIEPVVKLEHGPGRYYALMRSWMSAMREQHGVYLISERKIGFRVLPPDGVLAHGEKRIRSGLKQTGKAIKILGWVERERLDSIGQQRLDHQLMAAAKIKAAVISGQREFAVPLSPIKSLPRIPIPQQKSEESSS